MKRAVSLLIAAVLIVLATAIPGIADTEGVSFIETGAGYLRLTSYSGKAEILDLSTLELPGTINEIAAEAFTYDEVVKVFIANEGLERIDKFAFAAASALEKVILPLSLTTICQGAFAECSELKEINLPQTAVNFGTGIFDYTSDELVIGVYSGSAAEEYCKSSGYNYKLLDEGCDHDFSAFETFSVPTCTKSGIAKERCSKCLMFGEKSKVITALGHSLGQREAYEESFVRTCTVCEQKVIGFTDRMDADSLSFNDLAGGKWYSDAMTFCYENAFLAGTSETAIEPHTALSRSMTVTILAKVAGITLTEPEEDVFDDVPVGKWYTAAVKWAADNQIVSGYSEKIFAPKDPVTREQLALILFKFAENLGKDTAFSSDALDSYTDLDRVHDWAKDALCWAKGVGLISGMTESTIAPREGSTRAQAAVMLTKFIDIFMPDPQPMYDRVVIIGVDGAGNYWNKANTNDINKIFGAYATAKTPVPESCEANWASILHGVDAVTHGVTAYDNSTIPTSSNTGYPSFMSLVRDEYPDATLAAFSSWESLPTALIESDADVYTGYVSDDVRMTEDTILPYLEENDPKVLFVTYRNVALAVNADDTGNYGGEFHTNQLGLTDNCIGAIYKKYEELGRNERTLYILTSDHGGVEGERGHAGDTSDVTDIFVGFGGYNVTSGEIKAEMLNYDVSAVVLEALGIKAPASYDAKVPENLFTAVGVENPDV
ncbi:MAG: S-layer homology domain-containing protein [Clostridia bacterium]|nr:S-layer homology domain-containing protein [Clostridia bacterium]